MLECCNVKKEEVLLSSKLAFFISGGNFSGLEYKKIVIVYVQSKALSGERVVFS